MKFEVRAGKTDAKTEQVPLRDGKAKHCLSACSKRSTSAPKLQGVCMMLGLFIC